MIFKQQSSSCTSDWKDEYGRYLCEFILHNEKGVSYWERDSSDPAHKDYAPENNFIKYSSRSVNPSAAFLSTVI